MKVKISNELMGLAVREMKSKYSKDKFDLFDVVKYVEENRIKLEEDIDTKNEFRKHLILDSLTGKIKNILQLVEEAEELVELLK